MSYVIPLEMDNESRERFNENFEYVATKIIIGAGYVPVIFLIGTVFQVAIQHRNLGVSVCRLIAYSSVIGFIIMIADAIDNWLSLRWDDIEGVNKLAEIKRIIRSDILRIGVWIFNFIIFGFVLIKV